MKARGGCGVLGSCISHEGTRPPSRVHAISRHTSQPLKRRFLKKKIGGAAPGVVLPSTWRPCGVGGQN